jgi:hypothetical protein
VIPENLTIIISGKSSTVFPQHPKVGGYPIAPVVVSALFVAAL